MAMTAVENNNRLIRFTQGINREFVRQNMFSPYMSKDLNAIIRIRQDLVSGGNQMNIPMVSKLTGRGRGAGPLVGNEEQIDNYGMRVWVDWLRNAIVYKKNEKHKESAPLFEEARPLLRDWGLEAQRDEMIEAFMALPSESPPVNIDSDDGQRINGILYQSATAAQRNTWNADNVDRVLYGDAVANYNATHATALGNITTAMRLSAAIVTLAKRRAEIAAPAIHPYKLADGYEWYVLFVGSNSFRDLQNDATIIAANRDARPREGSSMNKNPLFVDGDLLYDGIIIRKIPQITPYVTNVWTTLKTAGTGSIRVEPYFLCGQQAATLAWGQMAKPQIRKEDDYGFIKGIGLEMAYGVSKMFKKHPYTGTALVQWGVLTGFAYAPAD